MFWQDAYTDSECESVEFRLGPLVAAFGAAFIVTIAMREPPILV